MVKTIKPAAFAAGLSAAMAAGAASAAGFALIEQSASGLGNAYAGTAALAEDASTVWWNPAGMSKLPAGRQVSVAAHAISPSTRFSDPGGSSVGAALTSAALSGSGGDAGEPAIVPNAYFTADMSPGWKMGLGINVPFGLSTKYEPTWIGRFQGIESQVKTINVNPSISWAASETLALGGGIDWQQGKIDLVTATNYSAITAARAPALFPGVVGPNTEGQNRTSLDGNAWGYNLGLMWDMSPAARLGVAYRSSVKYYLGGASTFSGRPAALAGALPDAHVTTTLKTPDSLSVSLAYGLDSRWKLLGDLTWTGWSKIKTAPMLLDNGATLDTLVFNFNDTIRTSVGANYAWSDSWTFKAGYALDQSPVPNAESRSVRLPDNDRNWLAFGAKYRIGRTSAVDLGYAHLAIKDAAISNDQRAAGKGLVSGNYKAKVDILSVQLSYLF